MALLGQKVEKSLAAAAEQAGDIKQQHMRPPSASSSLTSQADVSRAVSVAERALQNTSALEMRVKNLEAGAQGAAPAGGVDKRVAGVEEGMTRIKQQQTDDVSYSFMHTSSSL